MKFVIDTSVAVKWFLPESGHDTAVALLATEATLQAPDLIFTEFARALQKKIRLGEADWEVAKESCAALPHLFVSISPTLVLFQRALEIAVAMSHPVQDCIFLACAEQAGSCVVTADLKLIEKATERNFGHLLLGLENAVSAASRSQAWVAIPQDRIDGIVSLSAQVVATFEPLRGSSAALTERYVFVPANVSGPAVEAPDFLRLKSLIADLPISDLRDLVTVCWLGRGFDGGDWIDIREQAERLIGPEDRNYVLSLVSYLSAGLERARASPFSPDMHRGS
ncbi:hypothetical protein ASF60_12620 [Methylobacterium sp. Leaf113]|uniref:type II toxin-antitoxin system VapC family toxin n=1 Tax=Methylobacterium sp. Leaf113 TaxID=1736259 RepID=UPI0006FBFD49|nr:type II toxin-antitoxin system VapC family toxin [Methylobacterium sp. Leaf113]KQP94296.1 hypothetical protein ASF60_12620 [Methylobacterium sp. Leaf113]